MTTKSKIIPYEQLEAGHLYRVMLLQGNVDSGSIILLLKKGLETIDILYKHKIIKEIEHNIFLFSTI